MDFNMISPYVRYASKSYLCAPFTIGQRCIFDYEIIYLEFGKFIFCINEKEYLCQKGDFIFIRPGQSHTLRSIDNISISQPHVHFDMTYDQTSEAVYISFKDYPQFTTSERGLIRKDFFSDMDIGPILRIENAEEFRSCLLDITAAFCDKPALYQLILKQKMLQLIQIIIKDNMAPCKPSRQSNDIHALIKDFIDYNFKNAISLDSLEKQFHYSKFYISRVFVQNVGVPIIKYYNGKRLEYAKIMLKRGASVSSISQELNFNSIYAFSRYFKNSTGLSPTAYRKQATQVEKE